MPGLKTIINDVYTSRLLGIRVPRAAAADDVNTWTTIYTVTGTILLTLLLGVRTVNQGGAVADTMQFRHSVGPTVLDVGTLSILGDLVGNMYNLCGSFADPIGSCGAGAAALPIMGGVAGGIVATGTGTSAIIMGAGNIQVIHTNVAHTGSSRYVLFYIPVTTTGFVAAAP